MCQGIVQALSKGDKFPIQATKVMMAAVLPRRFQIGEVLNYLTIFVRNVESRGCAMLQKELGGSESGEALLTERLSHRFRRC